MYLSASLKTKLCCKIASIIELDNINSAILLRDLLNFWSWQSQKTKQRWETSFSKLEKSFLKNEAIFQDFLQKWKIECRVDSLVPMRFAIFRVHVSRVLRLLQKSDARSHKALHLPHKTVVKICRSAPQEISALIPYHIWLMCLMCRACLANFFNASSSVQRLP